MSRSRGPRRVVGLCLLAATLVVAAPGCSRQSGRARPDDAETTAVAPVASAFAERLRAAGKELAALEAQVRSMEPNAAIDLLEPLLRDEDPDLAERAADLLVALQLPRADGIVVRRALAQGGGALTPSDGPGFRRIESMGWRGHVALLDLYAGSGDEPLGPDLGEGCQLMMDVVLSCDHSDPYRVREIRRALLRCLTWEDVDTAMRVGSALASLDGDFECPRFSEMLRSDKPLERVAAVIGLRECATGIRWVPVLREALDDRTSLLPPDELRGPCDQPDPSGRVPCPEEEPDTIGGFAAQVIDNLTERELHGDAAAIEAWIGANLPPADNPSWMPRPLGPLGFWRDPRPIEPRDARRGQGDSCTIAASFDVDLRGDGSRYRVEWRKCGVEIWRSEVPGSPDAGDDMDAPAYVTFTAPGATEPSLAFSTLVPASYELGKEIDPDGYFLEPIVVTLRGGSERQVLVARGYGGNSGFVDWCFVGAVGDGIGCWSQPDLDARAERSVGRGEEVGFRDWQVRAVPGAEGPRTLRGGELVDDDEPEASQRRLTLEIGIYKTGDPTCCPSRGSFVAELTAHPTEPRLVLASFERRSAAETAADSDDGGAE